MRTATPRSHAPAPHYSLMLVKMQCEEIARALQTSVEAAAQAAAARTPLGEVCSVQYDEAHEQMKLANDEFLVECLKAEGELGGITKALNIDCHTIQLPLDDDGAFRKAALQALVHTVGAVCMLHDGSLQMKTEGLGFTLRGGWGAPYPHVNAPIFEGWKQKGCVLTLNAAALSLINHDTATCEPFISLTVMNKSIIRRLSFAGFRHMKLTVQDSTCLQLIFVDFLFKYDLHSHFTYHQDLRHGKSAVFTAVVKLTADESSLHVAGAAAPAVFKEIGDAHVLLSRMYHRSGASTARTVLAVFFYKIGRERTRLESAGVETDEQHEETQQGETAEGACSSDSDNNAPSL